jgi:hypothetical protein
MSQFVEQRRHRRHTSKLNATAVAGNGGLLRLATTIVNLSSSGAMLELADSSQLTDSVTLLYGHSIEPCTVVWKRDRHVGVRFDAPAMGSAA